jgi:AcrR family transcriptional regulator
MATPTQSRSTRDRPAKAPLSEASIVEAALEVCRADGIEAVTMRRVAAELDTGAASLYVYVRNRDELVAKMGDRVASAIPLETPDPADWREQIYRSLHRVLDAMQAHPGLAGSTLAHVPHSDPPFDFMENLLGLLVAGGVTRQDAAWACDILMLVTTATAIENDVRRDRGHTSREDMDEMVGYLRSRFLELPADRFPLTVDYANEMVTGDGDDRFRFSIDVMLDGMVARAQRARG